jgi:glycosyltransferase involved in cell wall biosynthesis
MPHRPKVSVCVPSYNHARFLPATLDSVFAQTYKDFEVVIVDDGSTDSSYEIAQSYAAKHPRLIRLLTHAEHKNRGISATVNLAFREARGEYWMGVPSDDMLYPDKLARQVEFLDAHTSVGWVYSYADYVDESGARCLTDELFGEDISRAADPLESLIQRNVVPGMTCLMRREVSERVGLHDESFVYSDWEYWARMMVHSKPAFINRSLVMYRLHTYNTSVGKDQDTNARRSLEVVQSLKRKSSSIGGDIIRPRTQALLDLQAAYYFFCLSKDDAAPHLASAFEADPSLGADPLYFTRWLRARLNEVWFAYPPDAPQCDFGSWALGHLPPSVSGSFARRVAAAQFATTALRNYRTDLKTTRGAAFNCFRHDPHWLKDKSVRALFIRSLLGDALLGAMHRLKTQYLKPDSRER